METLTFTETELKYLKERYSNLQQAEFDVFIEAAKRYRLNPLANQIYAQLRIDRKTNKRQMALMTGIDGYRLVADRTGTYAGSDDAVYDNEEQPNKATVTVYKLVGGMRCPFVASARWNQYCPKAPLDFMWNKMPHLMLGKVAEALALRKAFPADLSGIYTKEEMDQADPPHDPEEAPPAQRPVANGPKSNGKQNGDNKAMTWFNKAQAAAKDIAGGKAENAALVINWAADAIWPNRNKNDKILPAQYEPITYLLGVASKAKQWAGLKDSKRVLDIIDMAKFAALPKHESTELSQKDADAIMDYMDSNPFVEAEPEPVI